MKTVILSLVVMIGFTLSACASKEVNHDGSYDQANEASKEAHSELMRDIK